MATYLRPDVYVEQQKSGVQSIPTTAALVGAMIGPTRSGKMNTPTLVTSFKEFVENFANGLDTPYMENSYLPYEVYGFFANGGRQLYIDRIAHSTASVAANSTSIILQANNPGTWGNGLKLSITKNEDWSDTEGSENLEYDVNVTLGDSDSFTIEGVYYNTLIDTLKAHTKFKKWFNVDTVAYASSYSALTVTTLTLTGGVDGVSDLTDSDYTGHLEDFDFIADEVYLLSAPGWTTNTVDAAITAYCDAKYIHPILDLPVATTVADAKARGKSFSANGGAYYYPWVVMNDPLTDTLINVPTAGFVMGLYAETNENRGLGKVAAGVGTVVRGVVDVVTTLSNSDVDQLNPVSINCICVRKNYGICVWGARSLNKADSDMRYVSDILINYVFTKTMYNGTQFAVFEPNDETLWTNVTATLVAYLRSQYDKGVLRGASYDEAFFVSCNSANNTDETIREGQLIVDVGYAAKKPAEFVIIHLAHTMQS